MFENPGENSFWLTLGGAALDDGNLEMLNGYRHCAVLDLSNTSITSCGLEQMDHVGTSYLNLRRTYLGDTAGRFLDNFEGIQRLDLADTGITDRIGPYLAHLTSLGELNLSGTNVSDAVIPDIEKLPALGFLDLSRTRVTSSAIERLSAAKPGLRVVPRTMEPRRGEEHH